MKPTYEQLEVELAETKAELAETKAELAEIKAELADTRALLKLALEEIADLKEKLNLNSKNSSKPPSTDQKANTSSQEQKKRKSRKGIARSVYPPERVDKIVECIRENCPHCGSQSIENDRSISTARTTIILFGQGHAHGHGQGLFFRVVNIYYKTAIHLPLDDYGGY